MPFPNDLPPLPEPDSGLKQARPYNPSGGGGFGGGGYGSQGFGSGGINPFILQGLDGSGSNIPLVMRKRGISNPAPPGRSNQMPAFSTPGIPSGGDLPAGTMYGQGPQQPQGFADGGFVPGGGFGGPPGPTDTQDIKATPGEMVMNPGVTSNPTIAAILTLLNILGAGGQQEPQGDEGGGGFAFGGTVGRGGFGGFGAATPSFGQRPGANPGNGAWAAPPPSGGYQYNPEGGVTGGYNPSDPYGAYTHNRDTSFQGQGARDLGAFGNAGAFGPNGNPAIMRSALEGAQGTADALVRRNVTQADLGGLDPAQRAVAKLQAVRDSGRGVQDIMANTRAGVLQNQDAFGKGLYGQLLGGNLGFTGQTNDARLQDWLAGQQQHRQGNGIGGFIGGLAGTALGGYAGGLGQAAGAAAGAGKKKKK